MWVNEQRDGRPAEYRWHPLLHTTKFGWRPLLECCALMLPSHETRWNLELQTFRTQDLSFPRTKGPYGELSFPRNESSRNFVPWNFRSRALSFSETFVPGERKFLGTFVPGTFHTRELSFPLSDRPSRCYALLLHVRLWLHLCDVDSITLYVGRPAFAARRSVFDVPITVSLRTKRLR